MESIHYTYLHNQNHLRKKHPGVLMNLNTFVPLEKLKIALGHWSQFASKNPTAISKNKLPLTILMYESKSKLFIGLTWIS
jgi:hypothetical protein